MAIPRHLQHKKVERRRIYWPTCCGWDKTCVRNCSIWRLRLERTPHRLALNTYSSYHRHEAMSDREGGSGGTSLPDEELSLPKATVAKMITGTRTGTSGSVFLIVYLIVARRFTASRCNLCQRDPRPHNRVLRRWDLVTIVLCNIWESKHLPIRIHTLNIIRSERDLWPGVKKDDSTRTYYWGAQSMSHIFIC